MDKKEGLFRSLEIGIAVGALCLSLIAISISLYATISSNTIAKKANELSIGLANQENEIAKMSNSIALGREFEVPEIKVKLCDDNIDLTSFEIYKKRAINVLIENKSKVPLSEVKIHLYAISGLTYSKPYADDIRKDLNPIEINIIFRELVLPNGFVYVDIRKYLLNYILRISDNCEYKEKVYAGLFHIRVKPKKAGSNHFVQGPDISSNEDYIHIDFLPKLFIENKSLINDFKEHYRVSPGTYKRIENL